MARIFSILAQAVTLKLDATETPAVLGVEFSDDPSDSSVVRMRLEPPSSDPRGGSAIEATFDRNGRLKTQRRQPLNFIPWDDRPVEIQKAEAESRADAARKAEREALGSTMKAPKEKQGAASTEGKSAQEPAGAVAQREARGTAGEGQNRTG